MWQAIEFIGWCLLVFAVPFACAWACHTRVPTTRMDPEER